MEIHLCGLQRSLAACADRHGGVVESRLALPHNLPVIHLRDVIIRREDSLILDSVSWEVAPGENWVILGPNGAGKTTLLKVLTGYLWPTSGTVEVLGERFGSIDLREMRRLVALVSDALIGQVHEELSGLEVL